MPAAYDPQSLAILKRLTGGSQVVPQPLGPAATADMYDMGPDSTVVGTRAYNVDEERANQMARDAMLGLREAADVSRDIGLADTLAGDYDLEYRGPRRTGLQEDIADVRAERAMPREDLMSEAAAGRELAPMASTLHERGRRERGEDIRGMYTEPAEIRGTAVVDAAELERQGRLGAAGIADRSALREAIVNGLLRAYSESIQKGRPMTPEQAQGFMRLFAR